MKKSIISRIGVLALILSLASITVLSGTLAKYTSTATGTGTVNVAQWSDIQFEGTTDANADFTFNLADTKVTNNNVTTGQIAPGDSGSFEISMGQTEVAYTYSISIEEVTPAGDVPNIVFYSDAAMTTEITADITGTKTLPTADGVVAAHTTTVYWQWEYFEDATQDTADTALGLENGSFEFEINITATQLDAAP